MTAKNNKFKKTLDSKAFWVVVSLIASLLLWVYLTVTQEETITREFRNVEVVFSGAETLQESKGLIVTEADTEKVRIELTGTRANIGTLDESDIKAVIDLSKVSRNGDNRVAYDITFPPTVNASEIKVVSRSPENINFHVSKMSTKTVPVRGSFVGSTADGFVAEDPVFEPSTITLSGPDSELKNIDYVWATIGGDDLTKSRTADVGYVYMDADGNKLEYTDITADYDTVSVTLTINVMKEVPLSVTLVYGAGATEENCIVTIEPATITISGDSSIVDGINRIVLATIDLTDFSITMDKSFPIVLDNDVQNVTGTTEANVKIEVTGLETKKLFISNITSTNVPEGYTADIITQNLEVIIRAPESVIDNISAENLRAVADLTDYASTGDISVPVKIFVDGFTDAGAIGDYRITINISK